MGFSNRLSCEAESFSPTLPPGFFQTEVLGLYFPVLEPWAVQSVLLPSCSFRLWIRTCGTACSASRHLTQSMNHHLATSPLCPSCLSPPLLLVWMNVSSLTPWLLDFHTVWLSGSSVYFFVFKFVIVLQLVVWGGKGYLSTHWWVLSSGVTNTRFIMLSYNHSWYSMENGFQGNKNRIWRLLQKCRQKIPVAWIKVMAVEMHKSGQFDEIFSW